MIGSRFRGFCAVYLPEFIYDLEGTRGYAAHKLGIEEVAADNAVLNNAMLYRIVRKLLQDGFKLYLGKVFIGGRSRRYEELRTGR